MWIQKIERRITVITLLKKLFNYFISFSFPGDQIKITSYTLEKTYLLCNQQDCVYMLVILRSILSTDRKVDAAYS